ncbi:hypothetical protein J4Q44_G00389870 [Coregonus suidteri]|uniref:Uncharacterized protein n=1 Tax=Coregonus suidteri TaxID=861788 RepID=A0AAN8Q4A6_9TELE
MLMSTCSSSSIGSSSERNRRSTAGNRSRGRTSCSATTRPASTSSPLSPTVY